MRDHSKNIGKTVYFRYCGSAIHHGIIVEVKDYVRVFSYNTNKIEHLYFPHFRNINSSQCWAYEEKNVIYKPVNKSKPFNHKVLDFYHTRVGDFKTIEEFYKFLNIKHNHNYDNRLKRFYEFFKEDKVFKGFLVKDNHVCSNKTFDFKEIHFYIEKRYGEDETKPSKIRIMFDYEPPYQTAEWISINKFDKFVYSYKLIKGEKYLEVENEKNN